MLVLFREWTAWGFEPKGFKRMVEGLRLLAEMDGAQLPRPPRL